MRRAFVPVLVALAAAPGAAASERAPAAVQAPSRSAGAVVAKVVVRTVARPRPGAGPILRHVATQTAWGRGPQWLLVLGSAQDRAGRPWARVALPVRPNGTSGWIRADHLLLRRIPWYVEVSRSERVVSVYRDGRLERRFRAVVGAPWTPTPRGLFAVHDPIRQTDPHGFVGPWALHLTAFSNVLDDYGGGPGRVAIHGRGGTSLRNPLGSAASHGCVRIENEAVEWLARTVPRGTPVRIT